MKPTICRPFGLPRNRRVRAEIGPLAAHGPSVAAATATINRDVTSALERLAHGAEIVRVCDVDMLLEPILYGWTSRCVSGGARTHYGTDVDDARHATLIDAAQRAYDRGWSRARILRELATTDAHAEIVTWFDAIPLQIQDQQVSASA